MDIQSLDRETMVNLLEISIPLDPIGDARIPTYKFLVYTTNLQYKHIIEYINVEFSQNIVQYTT